MDVGSILGALTGGSGVHIEIRLNPPALPAPQPAGSNVAGSPQNAAVVPMDHTPSWRLHKNPFWRVKHPGGSANRLLQIHPSDPASAFPPNDYNNPNMNNPAAGAGYGGGAAPGMMDPSNPYYYQQQQQYNMAQSMPQSYHSHHHHNIVFAYESSQDIEGTVMLRLQNPGKKVEHLGIKVQFIGRIDMSVGIHEGRPHYDFISLSKELSPPSVLYQPETVLPFRFKNMDKEFESYRGRNASVRYIVKVVMERKFLPPLCKEKDVWVQVLGSAPVSDEAIKMEVGIEDCLHIEFEYDRRHYHLQDTIRGKIHFLLVRIKIKHMELAVIRRETSGEGVAIAAAASEGPTSTSQVDAGNIFTETQTLVKYEIMDGAPVKGEIIPVRLCLKGIPADITPTYAANNNRFSVRYFLNLVLVDEDDRRYFKQQEIILWRKELG